MNIKRRPAPIGRRRRGRSFKTGRPPGSERGRGEAAAARPREKFGAGARAGARPRPERATWGRAPSAPTRGRGSRGGDPQGGGMLRPPRRSCKAPPAAAAVCGACPAAARARSRSRCQRGCSQGWAPLCGTAKEPSPKCSPMTGAARDGKELRGFARSFSE